MYEMTLTLCDKQIVCNDCVLLKRSVALKDQTMSDKRLKSKRYPPVIKTPNRCIFILMTGGHYLYFNPSSDKVWSKINILQSVGK